MSRSWRIFAWFGLLCFVWASLAAEASGTAPVNLTEQGYSGQYSIYPRWADSDQHLLFLSRRTHAEYAIWMMDVQTQTAQQLTFRRPWVGQFSWDQKHRSLVYVARMRALDDAREEDYELFRLDLDTAQTTRLTHQPGWDGMPDWEPGGNHLAYQSCQGADSAVWVMDRTGRGVRRVTPASGWSGAPKWSPDGRWIAYESSVSGAYDLWVVHPDGSGARNLTADAAWDGNAVWRPDSQGLVYESDHDGNYDLWTIDLAGARRRLTDYAGWDAAPSVSPRGDKIAYHSAAGGAYEVRVLDLTTGKDACLLRRRGDVSALNPRWNAAGTSVACESAGDLFVVPVPDRIAQSDPPRDFSARYPRGHPTPLRVLPTGWSALRKLELSPYERLTFVDRYDAVSPFDFDASYGYFKPGGILSGAPGMARGIAITGDPVLSRQFLNTSDLMLRVATRQGESLLWGYQEKSYAGPGPWVSAYAQGFAIPMLLGAHAVSGESRFLEAARAALSPYLIPMDKGGVRYDLADSGTWYEEYAAPTYRAGHVLNGHMFALYGALDLWRATGDATAKQAFEDGLQGLRHQLPEYDDGTFSFYDLFPRPAGGYPLGKGKPADEHYDEVAYRELYWLWQVTGDDDLLERMLRFLSYNRQPDPLMTVTASNTMDEAGHGVSWLTDGRVRVGPECWSGRVPVALSLDLGRERQVYGVELFTASAGLPETLNVQVSSDGEHWSSALESAQPPAQSVHGVYLFEKPVRAQLLRIEVPRASRLYVSLTEVAAITRLRAMGRDLRERPEATTPPSLAAGPWHESALESGAGPFACSDLPNFVDLCLASSQRVNAVVVKTGQSDRDPEGAAKAMVVQASPDGLTWETVRLVKDAGPSARVPVGRDCRMLRVVFLETAAGQPLVVRQITAETAEPDTAPVAPGD